MEARNWQIQGLILQRIVFLLLCIPRGFLSVLNLVLSDMGVRIINRFRPWSTYCCYLLEEDCYLYGFEEENREKLFLFLCHKMKFHWYFVTVHALSHAFVSKYSFLPVKHWALEIFNFFKSLYQLSQIWQSKKEIDTHISNSHSQEYWSSPCSHWDAENLYSECALPFLSTLAR